MSSRDAAAAATMSSSDQQQQPQRRRRRRRQREAAQEQQHNSSNSSSSSSSSSDDGDTTTNVKQRRIDETANAHSECAAAAAATAVVERTDELVRSLAAASGEALTAVLSQWQTAEQRCREAATRHTTLSQQLVRTHAAHAEAAMAQHTLHAQLQLQTHAAATLQQQLQRSAAEAVADVWPRLTAMLQSPLQSLQTRVAAERALADALCRHARDVAQHAMTAMHAAAQRALRAELRVTEGAVSLTRLQAAYTHEQSRRIRHDAETAALLRIVAALTLRVRHGNADATALRRARAHVRALERQLSLRDVGAAVAAAHEAGAHDDVNDAVDSSSSSSNGGDTHTITATAAALHAVDSNDSSSSADGDADVPMPPRALRARTPQYYALRVLAHHKMTLCELVEAWSTQASRLAAADARDAALQQRVRAVQHDAGVVQARYVAEKLRREAAERRLNELMLERWGVADTSTTTAAAAATATTATTSLHSSQTAACPAGLLREVHTLREQCNTLRDDAAQHAVALAQARDEAARAQHAADALRTRVAQLEADVRGDDVAAALSQLRADYVEACDSMQRRCVDSETQLRLLATLAEERGSALQQALAALTRMRHDVAAAYTQQQQQQQSNTATSSNNKKGSTTTSVSDDEDSSRVDESPSWHSIDGDEARSGRRDSDASRSTTPSSPAAAAAAATTLLQQAEELQSVLTRAHDDARTQREAEERAMRQYATQLRSLVQSFETLTRNNNNNNSNNNNSGDDETTATATAATAAAAANTSVTHAVLTSALHFVTTQQTSSDAQRSALLDTALRDGACVQELCAQLSRLRAQRDRLRGLLARAYDTIERHHLTVAEQSLLHEVVTTTATSSSPSSALDEAEGAEQLATMRAQLTALQLARQGALDELQRATDATQQLEGRLSDEARQRDVLREHVDTLTAALHASLARESALHADKVALHHRVTALAANIAEATSARATNVQSAERVEGDNNNNNNDGDDGNKEDDVTALHDCVERMRATVDDLVALLQRNNESSTDTATLAVSSAAVRADDGNNKDDDDDDEQHAVVDTVPSEEQLIRRLWCAATDTTRDAVDGGGGSGSGVLRAMVHMLRDTMVQLGLLRRALRDAALQHNNTLAHIANNFVVAQDATTTTAATTTAAGGGDGDNNATATTVDESDGTEHATVTTTATTTTTHGADGDEDDKDDARMARLLGPTDAMRVAQLTLRARELAAQLQSTRDELAAAQRRADAADAAAHNAEAHNKRILAISKTLLEKQQALVRDNVALREQLAVYAAAAANTATAPTITTTTTTMTTAAAPPMPSTTTATTVHSEGDDAVTVTRADDTTHTQPTNADDAESTAAAPPHDDNNNNDMATGDEDDAAAAAAAAAAASVEHDEASEQPPLPRQEGDGGVVANDVADADAAAHDTSADAPS